MGSEFNPKRSMLYTVDELFDGFDPDTPATYAHCLDFRIYREFVQAGGAACADVDKVLAFAEHDCRITQAFARHLAGKRVVAVMGGHKMKRGSAEYRQVAELTAALAAKGYVTLGGGGPGAMEAIHLGAAYAAKPEELEAAINALTAGGEAPSGKPITVVDGNLVEHPDVIEKLGVYLAPAIRLRREFSLGGGVGVPTWLYGWEPTNAFASYVAKYFQNSIREDGLLAAATHGIVYVEGRAGTMQEVFQDAAQNYYRSFPAPAEAGKGVFSPMVFLGPYWQGKAPCEHQEPDPVEAKRVPVRPVVERLFSFNTTLTPEELARVQWTLTTAETLAVIEAYDAPPIAPVVKTVLSTSRG